jgi:tricorn protease
MTLRRLLLFAILCAPLLAQTKLLRFPDIHDSRVVFTYGGDLWLTPAGFTIY